MKAVSIVSKAVAARHAPDSTQARDVDKIRTQATNRFTSAARETFSSVVFPTQNALRNYDQFRMEFDNNDYNGEAQILQTLEQRGKYWPSAKIAKDMATLRMEAEAELFDADGVQRNELRRKAAAKPGWYWLEAGGLDSLIDECIRTKHWRLHAGLVEKKFTRETSLSVRLDGSIEPMIANGVYKLVVSPQDADTIYASETGDPNPAQSGKVISQTWETSAPKVSFIAVDSKKEAQTGPVHNWEAPINVSHEVRSTSNGYEISWQALPRSAEVRLSFNGLDPRSEQTATSPATAPEDCDRVLLIASVGGRFGEIVKIPLVRKGEQIRVVETVREDRPLMLKERQKFDSITKLTDAITALQAAPGSRVKGGRIEIATDAPDQFVDITFGSHVTMNADQLNALIKTASEAATMTATKASAAFNAISFTTGKDYKVYADVMKLDFAAMSWSQED